MMGSPKFVIQTPIIFIGFICGVTYLSSEHGRKAFVKHRSKEEYKPGITGPGYSTHNLNMKTHFDELDKLRKVNVQPFRDEKKEPLKK